MSTPFRIWHGGVDDAAMLALLHAPAFADAWPEPAFASLLGQAEISVLIGAFGGEAAQGFILVRNAADEAEVLTFCVAEGVRGRGLGRTLLETACLAARERGAAHVFLEVGADNAAALGLYRRSGFVEVGRRAAYYHHGPDASDALVMRRILNQDAP
ncbi:MAG: ribosomal protein S18-alanine N-acetyltransferase [Micropepsaceae bacterium]